MKKTVEVFNFNEEDELGELKAGKLVEKFSNPSVEKSPAPQHQRVQNICQDNGRQKELGNSSHVDAAFDESDHMCEDDPTIEAETEDSRPSPAIQPSLEAHAKETDVDQVINRPVTLSLEPSSTNFSRETSSPSQGQLNSTLSDSSSSQEQGDLMSANDESLSDHPALSPGSDSEGDGDLLRNWTAEHYFDNLEKIDVNTAVILSPEYVMLKDRPCAASLVIFSCGGVIIKGCPVNNEEETFTHELRVEDIVSIECNWFQNVGLVSLKIRVLLKDEECYEDMQHTIDIKELRLAVADYNWPEKQQKITLLNAKYRAVWNDEHNCNMEVTGDHLSQHRRYFPSFDESFDEVVYPKCDPDAVSLCKRDVDLLQPGIFINDTIIDFYIKYLKNQIQPEEMHRFHFFNSFFFRKLADLDKDPSSIADGKAAFQRVRKWTRKVDIFGKDYIFIPVNFNLHWSLIVICHLGEVADYTDVDMDSSTKVPCILHMDSILGSHAGLKNLVQGYLCEEWKERHKDTTDDVSSKFLNLRFVSLELPQQENSFDCGLFLLHYLELFLAEAPCDFNPFRISKASNFLYMNWFPPAEASLKRTLIQKLIYELLENRSREVSGEQNQLSEGLVQGAMQSEDAQGIEMTLLERSSMKDLDNTNESGIVLRELFDSRAATGSLLGQLQSFEEPSSFYHLSNVTLSQEQVETEDGEQFMCLNSGQSHFSRITETTTLRSKDSISLGSERFEADPSWNLGMSVEGEVDDDSLSETATSLSEDSDIGIVEEITPLEEEEEAKKSPETEIVSKEEPLPYPKEESLVPSREEDTIKHDIEMAENESGEGKEESGDGEEKREAKRQRLTRLEENGETGSCLE